MQIEIQKNIDIAWERTVKMLKPAQLYKEKLQEENIKAWYKSENLKFLRRNGGKQVSDDLISRKEAVKGINELMESPYANSKEFGFELGFARRGAMEMVKSLCVNSLSAAYDMDAVLMRLHNAGGCDGSTEYVKGWDDAMEEAERIVKAGRKSDASAGWKEHIARRFGRVE